MEEWRGLTDGAARPANQGAGKEGSEGTSAPMGKYTEISRVAGRRRTRGGPAVGDYTPPQTRLLGGGRVDVD